MTKKPPVLAGAAILLLAAGFGAGYRMAERRATVERSAEVTRSTPLTVLGTSDRSRREGLVSIGSADEERTNLRERILAFESQLPSCPAETARSASPEELAGAGRAPDDEMLSLGSGNLENPERFRLLIAGRSRMDPALAKGRSRSTDPSHPPPRARRSSSSRSSSP